MSTSTALFGGPKNAMAQKKKYLVQFRAGRMFKNATTNMVEPDRKKGLCYVHRSPDGLMHFCWKDRKTETVEEDLIIFPDDIIFVPVKKAVGGRVFLLKFKTEKRHFYWMQEPDADKDSEYCQKVNRYLNDPSTIPAEDPAPGMDAEAGGLGNTFNGNRFSGADVHELLNSLQFNSEMMNMLGMNPEAYNASVGSTSMAVDASTAGTTEGTGAQGAAGSGMDVVTPTGTTTDSSRAVTNAGTSSSGTMPTATGSSSRLTSRPATATSAGSTSEGKPGGKIQLSQLQNILSSLPSDEHVYSGGSICKQPPPGQKLYPDITMADLSDCLKVDTIKPLLQDAAVIERLKAHLPETGEINANSSTDDIKKALTDTVQSPFFKTAARAFGAALQSGQMADVVRQFKLGSDAETAAVCGDLVSFGQALQSKEKDDSAGTADEVAEGATEETADKPKDSDEKMDTE